MTKEQYEKLKEYIGSCVEAQKGGWKFNAKVQREKELDELMGFDSTNPMESDGYKD